MSLRMVSLVEDNRLSIFMPTLADYQKLLSDFISRSISTKQFEQEYLEMFKSDSTIHSEEVYSILNGVFLDIDAFQDDPALRGERGIDEATLRLCVERGLKSLNEHISKG